MTVCPRSLLPAFATSRQETLHRISMYINKPRRCCNLRRRSTTRAVYQTEGKSTAGHGAASMGRLVCCKAGEKGMRFLVPKQPRSWSTNVGGYQGQADRQSLNSRAGNEKLKTRLNEIYVSNTPVQPLKTVKQHLADHTMSSREAKDLGPDRRDRQIVPSGIDPDRPKAGNKKGK